MTTQNVSNNTELRHAFEEFQLFYESAEKVTERRIETNRWNYSICIAILTAIAFMFGWAFENPSFLIITVLGSIVLSIMAYLFCTMWIEQIHSFKMLNTAKFEVLSRMALKVSFSPSNEDIRVSFSPFDKEWEILQAKNQALEEIKNTNILALKSSNMEYLIPKAFRILFGIVILVAFLLVIVNWNLVMTTPLLVHITPTISSTPIATATP